MSPYNLKGKNESTIKIFSLKNKDAYNLSFKNTPCTILKKRLIEDFKQVVSKFKESKDKINLKEKWSTVGSKEDKLVKCLENLIEKSVKQAETFDVQKEIL